MLSLFGFHKVAEMRGDGLLPEFLSLVSSRPPQEIAADILRAKQESQRRPPVRDELDQPIPERISMP